MNADMEVRHANDGNLYTLQQFKDFFRDSKDPKNGNKSNVDHPGTGSTIDLPPMPARPPPAAPEPGAHAGTATGSGSGVEIQPPAAPPSIGGAALPSTSTGSVNAVGAQKPDAHSGDVST